VTLQLATAVALAFVLCSPRPAAAADILETEAEHQTRLQAQPGAGVPQLIDFENIPFGPLSVSPNPFAQEGVEFSPSPQSLDPLVILPGAFGQSAIGSGALFAGFQTGVSVAEITVHFDEPQLAFSAFFLDVGAPMDVEVFLAGSLQEAFIMEAEGDNLPGGVFRAIWFDGQADEVRFVCDQQDGLGLDNVSSSEPGTVDNDGDTFSEVGPDGIAGTADDDCNDQDNLVNPNAFDGCDGVDTDCDGIIDNGPGLDADGDGFSICPGVDQDCDDDDDSIFPGAPELCELSDNDCDGIEDNPPDIDGDTFTVCDGDCDETNSSINPGVLEVCFDNIDNNCDGDVDESPDFDGDGETVCQGDCDDNDPTVFSTSGCPPTGDDDDTTVGDDDDTTVGDDDDTTVGDDDDTSAGDDDDTSVGDDDDTSGDDDDSAGDDDDSAGDDDDSASGDDDDTSGDDDDTSGDDDDTSDDDDSAGDDDDSVFGDDDDSIGLGPVPGIAGGGCECQLSAPLEWNSPGLALLFILAGALLPRRRR